ncbi:MAG TPA: polynucleotide kinase-phosphatase [Polyangium sp.]|nr:polynucleotide kinase-phosphatase [Polyangium sp.]
MSTEAPGALAAPAKEPTISLPTPSLVLLVGASGSGKSTFARKHFAPTEVVSSDMFRAMVADDENDQSASASAFEVLHLVVDKRLEAGKLVVVDATNVRPEFRKPLVAIARKHHVFATAIAFDVGERVCAERNETRMDRNVAAHVVRRQSQDLRTSLRGIEREGIRVVHVLRKPEEIEGVHIERTRLWTDRRDEHGPFDIIGDVHGCCDELEALLEDLGYTVEWDAAAGPHGVRVTPPPGRRIIFLGDLVDRGPRIVDVLRLVMTAVQSGAALCVPGNHEVKLLKVLRGRQVTIMHGLAETLAELASTTEAFQAELARFIDDLVSHYVLDEGRLCVAHAGMKASMQGRSSGGVREFGLYGDTTGETDEYGLPVRHNWASEYRGRATVVYGHTPVPTADWLNNTICVDTGCVFGGSLTALRYPEREIVSVPAARQYCEPKKPLIPIAPEEGRTAQQAHDDTLDIDDVIGKRPVSTRLARWVTVREENAAAALEAMSRFAVDPRWLVYLPPTMSPTETSELPGMLEHPAEAFAYFRRNEVPRVICEEKHMGSRAVIVVCRDEATAKKQFGTTDGRAGIVYTRTGRPFFDDPALEEALLLRVRRAAEASGLFDELGGWFVLDAEIMPWSAKAQALVRVQYAPVGSASRSALGAGIEALVQANARGIEAGELLSRMRERARAASLYVDAYRRYCWPVARIEDYRVAPFHLLAAEGSVFVDRDHPFHLAMSARLAEADGQVLVATRHVEITLGDEASERTGAAWWEELTASGGEGMVVKPISFLARGKRGLVQPAVKCRGRESLRIIYGPEYDLPENLARLRNRGLGAKRSLALRELALGVEALERFVRGEPLRRVHECVFAILALESEPVDPRL